MLVKRKNPEHDRMEWALISKTTRKVLKWFGIRKPSKAAVAREEARISWFENKD